jgi:hypothetical protein
LKPESVRSLIVLKSFGALRNNKCLLLSWLMLAKAFKIYLDYCEPASKVSLALILTILSETKLCPEMNHQIGQLLIYILVVLAA